MDLFPIGEIANSQDYGTMDSCNYDMFEPNSNTMSQPVYNNLITLFQNQARMTRKKAEPHLSITYNYENIFDSEYRQIEHFVDYVEDALNSFYTVDWSRHQKVLKNAADGTNWKVYISRTRPYSTTENKNANYMLLWNGSSWKLGQVITVSKNLYLHGKNYYYVTITPLYGNLSRASAQTFSLAYPVYSVYFTPAALSEFEATVLVYAASGSYEDGGWMRSGSLTFISKYSAI
jgi:hypothetical protein